MLRLRIKLGKVVMEKTPEDKESSLQDTLHLLFSKKNTSRLLESISQAEKGNFVEVDLD
jgi:PHD/YefM family antitoxin component YafN of YafNO toxin-antitoxin module